MTPQELEDKLRQFTGTEGYHHWSSLFRNAVLTDGAGYLAEETKAYWLMDVIASHMPSVKDDTFAVAKLVKREKDWRFTLEDGDDNVHAEQIIEYSDFPLDEIMLYVGRQEMDNEQFVWVIMLPSEY